MGSTQGIFTLVSDPKDKAKVLEDLVRYSADIKVKALEPKSDVFLVNARTITGNDLLCKVMGPGFLEPGFQQVIAQFHLAEQKYISQVKAKLNEGFLTLNFSAPIYRVQRREDFRLRLPLSFKGRMIFLNDDSPVNCRLIDMSAGGCRVEAPISMSLKVNEVVRGRLSTTDRDDITVEMSVRHLASHADNDTLQLVGLQFVNQSEIVRNRMAALVMDLYREFFTKRSG